MGRKDHGMEIMGDVDRIRAQRVLVRLRAVASELSGYEPADLNEASTFLELGFDSLFLTQLATAFQREYGLKITFRQLFDELPTLRALADHIDRQLPPETPVTTPATPAADTTPVCTISEGCPLPDLVPSSEPVPGEGPTAWADPAPTPWPASGAVRAHAGIQRVMAQQLAVMSEQLQLLRSLKRAGATLSTPLDILAAATSIEASPAAPVSMAKDAAAGTPAVSPPIHDGAAEPAHEQMTGSLWRRALPLTAGQREIWIASQMGDVASCAFNESTSVLIGGPLDTGRFVQAVTKVLAEQESFRCRFDREGTSQWVDAQAAFDLPIIDLSELDEVSRSARLDALIDQESLTPFDLEGGPLVRGWLARLGPESHLFVIYCHHIIFDGYSSEIVMRKIAEAYSPVNNPVGPASAATVPYSVYIHRAELRKNEESAASVDYWRTVFAGELPTPLDLPTDRPRDSRRSYRGGTVHRELDAKLSQNLRNTAKVLNTSVFVLLLSSFQALVSRLSNQEDIVVGVPMAGQARLGLDAVGYCVNALPVRAAAGYAKPFAELARETRRKLLDAFDHQETSLGEIVRTLRMPRDPSRLPLVEVFFNYSSYSSNLALEGCTVTTRENPRRAIYYDMFFCITESSGRLAIDWRYCSDLFDESTIERWVDHYSELLKGVVGDSQQAIGDLPLLSTDQSAEITAMWGRS